MAKVLYISDFDIRGSGYLNISIPLLEGLVVRGHEVKALGLSYDGSEHSFKFSLIPARNLIDVYAMCQNLAVLWKPDVIVASMDIPIHARILDQLQLRKINVPYIGIFPIESGPLTLSWAMILMRMQGQLCISKFGTEECHLQGVSTVDYLPVGVDTISWRIPSHEERSVLRESFGFKDNTFVILTVADNQERKNLTAAMEVISRLVLQSPEPDQIKYLLVTREFNEYGYRLRDYATELGIGPNVMIFERGMPFSKLWAFYAVSDAFLLTSKAEGLGMPILEAMSVGIPVVGTDCSAIHEHLQNGRGYLAKVSYKFRDTFGNAYRYLIDVEDAVSGLEFIRDNDTSLMRLKAKKYVEAREWAYAVQTLNDKIKQVLGDTKNEK